MDLPRIFFRVNILFAPSLLWWSGVSKIRILRRFNFDPLSQQFGVSGVSQQTDFKCNSPISPHLWLIFVLSLFSESPCPVKTQLGFAQIVDPDCICCCSLHGGISCLWVFVYLRFFGKARTSAKSSSVIIDPSSKFPSWHPIPNPSLS